MATTVLDVLNLIFELKSLIVITFEVVIQPVIKIHENI
jgi:hypothetical protein